MPPLAALIRSLGHPLDPLPTGLTPVLPRLEGIRCVASDIYGTLVISGSGDIGTATGREEIMRSLIITAGLDQIAAVLGGS